MLSLANIIWTPCSWLLLFTLRSSAMELPPNTRFRVFLARVCTTGGVRAIFISWGTRQAIALVRCSSIMPWQGFSMGAQPCTLWFSGIFRAIKSIICSFYLDPSFSIFSSRLFNSPYGWWMCGQKGPTRWCQGWYPGHDPLRPGASGSPHHSVCSPDIKPHASWGLPLLAILPRSNHNWKNMIIFIFIMHAFNKRI